MLYSTFKDHPDVFFLATNEDNDLAAAKDFLKKENYSIPIYKTNGNVPADIFSGSLLTTVVLDKVTFHHKGFANYAAEKFVKQIEELLNE